jgi:hypothetical protein
MAKILQRRKTAFEFRIFDSFGVQIKNGEQSNSRHLSGVTNGGWTEPQGSKLNKDFYDYFKKRLELAESEIWITGEGFTFSDDSGVKQAQEYNEQMENALKRDVHITRFQTAEPCHPEWAKMLKKLCENYPNNFHLYIKQSHKIDFIF